MSNRILAIETSSEHCSVAIKNGSEVQADLSTTPRGHANRLLPMIHGMLDVMGLGLNQFDAIAVTNGPGAFTSIRIGTAVCQGLAAAADLPVITASSLEVMALDAMQQAQCQRSLVALDARMDEVYFGMYQANKTSLIEAMQPDQVAAPEKLDLAGADSTSGWVSAGIGWSAYSQVMHERFANYSLSPVDIDFPDARALLTLAVNRWQHGKYDDVRCLRPVYLRDNVVNS